MLLLQGSYHSFSPKRSTRHKSHQRLGSPGPRTWRNTVRMWNSFYTNKTPLHSLITPQTWKPKTKNLKKYSENVKLFAYQFSYVIKLLFTSSSQPTAKLIINIYTLFLVKFALFYLAYNSFLYYVMQFLVSLLCTILTFNPLYS